MAKKKNPFNQVDKPLASAYSLPLGADPMEPDVEIDIPPEFTSEETELEDGSVILGATEDELELPSINDAPHESNLVSYFDEDELTKIAEDIVDSWKADDEARDEWKQKYLKGLKLLGMKNEEKDEPFPGASGVFHPLLAEAVVQFQAQAYKEILPAGGPVLTKVLGPKTPERLQQAARVQEFMNYLIMEVMEEYDPNVDQLLFNLPLAGSAFKKTYLDPAKDRTCSIFVKADNLTVPYGTTDLASASRICHDFVLSGNDLLKYQESGWYSRDHEPEPLEASAVSEIDDQTDDMQGVNGGYYQYDENYQMLEAHVYLDHEVLNPVLIDDDIDDEDLPARAALPYVVTLDPESNAVMSIRRNYRADDPSNKRLVHFTHYKFLPGLGFYGYGLIHMIGGLTESVTSILRQLIDAGTFSNLPGGLKTRGMRVDGEDDPIAPGEFRDVDVATGSIRDSIMPLPYKEPSAVLLALLGGLVESGQRFASIADMQVGDTSGQQQPVGTTVAMLERGTKVMSSIHKRIHRAQKAEFKILVRLIKNGMSDEPYPYSVEGADMYIVKQDFDDRVDVIPVSDPNIFSMAQRIMLASQQLQMAQSAPEIHDLREAYYRMYSAMGITDIESLLKPKEEPKDMSPVMENRRVLENKKLEATPGMDHAAHIQAHIQFLKSPYVMSSMEFSANMVQDIMNHIVFLAEQEADKTGVSPIPIELKLFEEIMPQLSPPNGPDLEALQTRQLDIDEQENKEDAAIDREQMKSKERIADNKNITTLIAAEKKQQ